VVALQHHVEMEELEHKAIKVEKQFKPRRKPKYGSSSSGSSWKSDRKDHKSASKLEDDVKVEESESADKGKTDKSSSRARDVKCFKCRGLGHITSGCPNKRVMIVKGNGDIESKSSNDDMPPLEDVSDEEPARGKLIAVVKKDLGERVNEETGAQRGNTFRTRCLEDDQACSMMIDSGSSTNTVSTLLVEKLHQPTVKHPRPYKLQWFNERGVVRVTKQVLVTFSIGSYTDGIPCGVAPTHAGHILLGRPRRFDRRVTYDGFKSCYSFVLHKQLVDLAPIKACEAHGDQVKILSDLRERGKHTSAQCKNLSDTLVSNVRSVLFARSLVTNESALSVPGKNFSLLQHSKDKKITRLDKRHVRQVCKRRQGLPFESGRWVGKHKASLPRQRRSKLQSRAYDSLQEFKIRGNTDSRTNPSKEGGNDVRIRWSKTRSGVKVKRRNQCETLEAEPPALMKKIAALKESRPYSAGCGFQRRRR